ncbi:MAG: alpha-L-rhamnosidase C-terminal domain-containing protein [bacterium]
MTGQQNSTVVHGDGWIKSGDRMLYKPYGLLCDLLAMPEITIIENTFPQFGWIVPFTCDGDFQTAYQIQVTDDSNELFWDSGRIASDASLHIKYNGIALTYPGCYKWRVRTWNKNADISDWSDKQIIHIGNNDTMPTYPGRFTTSRYPLQITEVSPLNFTNRDDRSIFLDFGRAAFGTIQFTANASENITIEVHLGEKTSSSNVIDRLPGGTIRYRCEKVNLIAGYHTYQVKISQDTRNTGTGAILMPDGLFEVLPFRYAEIYLPSGVTIDINSVRQLAVHYPFNENAADFKSDNDNLNKVWELCKYTIKATSFCGVYVDGDRERIPYEADAYINQLCHYATDREFTMARYSHEYLIQYPTWPTEWLLHSVLMAWDDYMYTGDAKSLIEFYDDLKVKSLIALAREDGLISTETGLITDELTTNLHMNGPRYIHGYYLKDIVDWPPGSFTNGGIGERDDFEMTAINNVVNAFHYRALLLMSKIAEVTGHLNDKLDFEKQAKKVYTAFNEIFFDKTTGIYRDGEDTKHSSLHANIFPLALGLVPQKHIKSVVDFIISSGMACSVYGAQYLLESLYNSDATDYALSLMTAEHDRGWIDMINAGSTMTLEAWNIRYKNNLDWNHAWGAAPANIIPRFILGIRPLEPGFKHILIAPQPGSLQQISGKVPTIRGTITLLLNTTTETQTLNIDIPANTTAKVILPRFSPDNPVMLNGKAIKVSLEGVIEDVGSGQHLIVY